MTPVINLTTLDKLVLFIYLDDKKQIIILNKLNLNNNNNNLEKKYFCKKTNTTIQFLTH